MSGSRVRVSGPFETRQGVADRDPDVEAFPGGREVTLTPPSHVALHLVHGVEAARSRIRLVARHRAIEVSSVHWPAFR